MVQKAFLMGSVGLSALSLVAQPQQKVKQPNVLFIAVDDWNNWMGKLDNYPRVLTPNIDRLADRGTLFANAQCQAPLSNPSRASLMTGYRPSSTGIYGLAPSFREAPATEKAVTLGQYFEQHGYETMAAGKIFHGSSDGEVQKLGTPNSFLGFVPKEKLVKAPAQMAENRLVDWGPLPLETDTTHPDYKVATWAEKEFKRIASDETDKPFFMAAGFTAPHVPLYAEQKWFDLYPNVVLPAAPENDREDVPDFAWYLHWYLPEPRLSWLLEHEEWENKVRAYLATITFMDAQVGRLLDALEAEGLSDETIVVLWSDNGYHMGEKEITGKNSLWEPSANVPLIFAGPGVTDGAISSQPAELLDIYPTLLELAGLPFKNDLEGLSLVPQLKDANTKRDRPAITTANPGNHSVRSERWRYIRYADGSEELYDHLRDPHEWKNLAGESKYADVMKELASWLPKKEVPHAPGSRHRTLRKDSDTWLWEDKPIVWEELIH